MIFRRIIFCLFVLLNASLALAEQNYLSVIKELIEEVRPNSSMKEIDQFLNLSPSTKPGQDLEKSAAQITDFIFKSSKISADTSYLSRNNKDNILPDSVIKFKQGDCLGLTTLFLLIAEKNGLKSYLVRGPDHVFPRLCERSKCLNVEMLSSGEIKEDSYYITNLSIRKEALDKKLYLASLDSPKELKASIYLGLGFVANKTGQKAIAELFYIKSAQNSEKFAEPHSNLAAIYAESGRIDEAANELKTATEMNPTHYASLINLGAIEQSKGKNEVALEYYSKAIDANPIAVAAYRKRSSIYWSRKDWKNASLDLDRILIIEPRFCDVIEDRIAISEQDHKLAKANLWPQLKQLQTTSKCLLLPRR